jgi:glycerophosphoryl diester phosphodiesterase
MKLIPWTINEVSDLERIMLLGVHGIISGYPDKALEIYKGLQLSKE